MILKRVKYIILCNKFVIPDIKNSTLLKVFKSKQILIDIFHLNFTSNSRNKVITCVNIFNKARKYYLI